MNNPSEPLSDSSDRTAVRTERSQLDDRYLLSV